MEGVVNLTRGAKKIRDMLLSLFYIPQGIPISLDQKAPLFPPHSVKLLFLFLFLPFQGVSVLVLESPFYGSRRPEGQKGSKLRVVSDLLTLGWATIFESICLLHMMNRREGYPRMCEHVWGEVGGVIFESICLLHMMNRREGYPRMCEQDGGGGGAGNLGHYL